MSTAHGTDTEAIILAGGKGSRLQEVIFDVPKPMAPVGGKPFLEHLVNQLTAHGVGSIVMATGYKGDIIQSHFKDGRIWKARIRYSEEEAPLGTGGALRKALQLVTSRFCLVMNGDSIVDAHIDALVRYHESRNAAMTFVLVSMQDTDRYGFVELNEDNEITGFQEKGRQKKGLINAGIYAVNKDLQYLMPHGPFSLETDFIPQLVGKGLFGFVTEGFFIDIGIPADYRYITTNFNLLKFPKADRRTFD